MCISATYGAGSSRSVQDHAHDVAVARPLHALATFTLERRLTAVLASGLTTLTFRQ
ncbi:hypothetical protein FA95DRAFT_1566062 [Auriscalpium vulgare]|uniref:Uncharacterized protein n=2 Tax=Auriscalpium vulgare TaxID=40419 RepID=A0ACB8RB18_9AGAM|nr:hypothetical protein FA95DRAFT_1566060 [Auriscalpium vulgare]KAI0040839.1 hypothetical protein FA95DRAFT_1566062 [Auriscalpium vulgare]